VYTTTASTPSRLASLHHLPQHEFHVVGKSGLRSIAHPNNRSSPANYWSGHVNSKPKQTQCLKQGGLITIYRILLFPTTVRGIFSLGHGDLCCPIHINLWHSFCLWSRVGSSPVGIPKGIHRAYITPAPNLLRFLRLYVSWARLSDLTWLRCVWPTIKLATRSPPRLPDVATAPKMLILGLLFCCNRRRHERPLSHKGGPAGHGG